MGSRSLSMVVFSGALLASALGAEVPIGPQFRVNAYTTGRQYSPSVAASGSGGFVVAWSSSDSAGTDQDGYSVHARRFQANGTPLGQFQVDNYTTGHQLAAAVAVAPDGRFVVAWHSDGSPGDDTDYTSVQTRRYTANGGVFGPQFQVNTWTAGEQEHASVAMFDDGSFVVVWESYGADGEPGYWAVQGRRYAADGSALGPEFTAAAWTTGDQTSADVAVQADGSFVVVWESFGSAGGDLDGRSVQGRRFALDGSPLGPQFQVNEYTTSEQTRPAVAEVGADGFVVVWTSRGSAGSDDDSLSIQARRFATTATPLGPEFQVNTYTTGAQSESDVTGSDGAFVVVWTNTGNPPGGGDGDLSGIALRRFSVQGTPLGPEWIVNSYTSSIQRHPAVTSTPAGDFVVVWESLGSDNGDTSYTSIQGQRFQVTIFVDGFESGSTAAWSSAVP